MRLVSYIPRQGLQTVRLGVVVKDRVIDLHAAQVWAQSAHAFSAPVLPDTMLALLQKGSAAWENTRILVSLLQASNTEQWSQTGLFPPGYREDEVVLLPPLPRPVSLRDFYAFEQHVTTAYANRGKEVPVEWYHFPVFYFSNPNAMTGTAQNLPYPAYSQALDYELEVACIIGSPGRNIHPEDAEKHIFGYTILNDWSARDIQRKEMRVGLGPAKGKDFACSLGPWITTPDELADRSTGRAGVYDLQMSARINGVERSRGNWKDLHFSFGEIIARASQGVTLLPGEVIGSGTVGSGCLLELTRGNGPWLKPGDTVELEVERLGKLSNLVSPPTPA